MLSVLILALQVFGCSSTPKKPHFIGAGEFSPEKVLLYAEESYLVGDFEGALVQYNEYFRAGGEDSNQYYWRGNCLRLLGKDDKAIKDYRMAIEASQEAVYVFRAYLDLGRIYCRREKFEDGLRMLAQASKLKSEGTRGDQAALFFLYGVCLLETGDILQAQHELQMVVNEFPESYEAELVRHEYMGGTLFYVVQTGAFSDEENAEKQLKLLSENGYSGYIDYSVRNDKKLYRVRIDPRSFQGKLSAGAPVERAEMMQKRLKEELGIDGSIVLNIK